MPDPNNPLIALIPVMTSHTTPSGEASASSETDGTKAFLAFDNSDSTFWSTASGGGAGSYIQYKFDSPKRVNKMEFTTFRDINTNKNSFNIKVQGSNDGTSWTDISNELTIDNTTDKQKSTHNFVNAESYLYYRILYFTPCTTYKNGYCQARIIQMYGI